ncbi:MAG TPA: DUF2283 domain-containing protein [Nanoarchaeota archaeon]|nr:DUF2283 domain-containing protein [Candidatus Woesearchaeota archaeon]HIH15141.1 DUF2283 domain-containing protein [Nanoarchaeota archaeon]HIH59408.1 DUF2283 domain-containing protein [Nanoarchaeota archaeon]HII14312.1 DUF2283 domain-containing protein [Nanoarchaeota archaeon]HIJ04601.1 DUF2283 domain-containing protein [Nanoarchaeota archaeon]
MEIRYDKEADAMYIKLDTGKFAKNKIIDDLTILDLDSNRNLLGIELLDVSKGFSKKSLQEIRVKNMVLVK